jgi:hypothetical protein
MSDTQANQQTLDALKTLLADHKPANKDVLHIWIRPIVFIFLPLVMAGTIGYFASLNSTITSLRSTINTMIYKIDHNFDVISNDKHILQLNDSANKK